jgi:hypothetical protein
MSAVVLFNWSISSLVVDLLLLIVALLEMIAFDRGDGTGSGRRGNVGDVVSLACLLTLCSSPSDVELDNFSNIGSLDTIADGLQEPSASAAQPEPRILYETEIQINRHEMEWSNEEALIRMRREERLEYM